MSTNRTFNDIIKEFEEKTYEELLSLASGALSLVAKAFSNLANTERPGELILPFIFTTLGVDGELSEIEAKFLNDLFNADFDYDALKNYALAYNDEEIVELIDKLIDICDDETKAAMLIFCTCFAAVDSNVTCKETEYLVKLYS
jgi:hypothetical protein